VPGTLLFIMKINIYHTNDIHSNYDFLKKVHKFLTANKGENDFYFDSGDFSDLKDLIVQADKGFSAMDLLNSAYLDYMAIGNNEIDLGYDDLCKLAAKAHFVSCNITDNDKKALPGIKPYVILEKQGIRFLVIGASPYYNREMASNNFNAFFCLYGLQVWPSIEIIKNIIVSSRGKYDYCILLAHNGSVCEENIMKMIPEIDLCLGGHSHELLNNDSYSQSGQGNSLGLVSLDIEDGIIKIIENCQLDLTDDEDKIFDDLYKEKLLYANNILEAPLKSVNDLFFNPLDECLLLNFVCDALYKHFDGDFAIMHNGIANKSLTRPVSRKTIIEAFPSKLNPTMYSISGEKIYEAIISSFDEKHIKKDGKGAGFRGYILGTLSYSHNVSVDSKTREVFINGELLDKNREYRIITDDYLQRGSGYPSLKVHDDLATWDIWFIRDLVEYYIADEDLYNSAQIRRKK